MQQAEANYINNFAYMCTRTVELKSGVNYLLCNIDGEINVANFNYIYN